MLNVKQHNIWGIITEVKLEPESQPRDSNNRVVLFSLSTLGRKHIQMVRSIAEDPIFLKYWFYNPQFRPISWQSLISFRFQENWLNSIILYVNYLSTILSISFVNNLFEFANVKLQSDILQIHFIFKIFKQADTFHSNILFHLMVFIYQ